MLNIKREITDLKEKIKYIKDIQKSNKKELKRKFVLFFGIDIKKYKNI